MFCKNCGNQLNGTENVCPNCGTPVEKIEELTETESTVAPEPIVEPTQAPIVEPTPIPVEETQAPIVEPTQASVVEQTQAPVVEPIQQPAPTPTQAPVSQPQQKNNMTLILVIILVGLLIAGAIVFFALNSNKSTKTEPTTPETPEVNNNGGTTVDPTNPAPVSTDSDNKVSYGGYTFTIPTGYETDIDEEYGLLFGNDSIVYSIITDYTNSFEKYQEKFTQKYPNEIKDALETVGSRKYLVFRYKGDDDEIISQYITEASNNTTFIGLVARMDKTGATRSDYEVLTKVLDSTSSASSFSAADKKDAGTKGIVDYNGSTVDGLFKKLK